MRTPKKLYLLVSRRSGNEENVSDEHLFLKFSDAVTERDRRNSDNESYRWRCVPNDWRVVPYVKEDG